MKRLLLLLGVVLVSSGPLYAGGHQGCCADCGCNHGLRKVCRWVCEEVEEKVPGWDCECEDIVIPGKSPFCIKDDCDECCEDGCRDCAPRLGGRLHQKKVWGPPCGCCVKTVNVLVRTEKTVKKKVWKPVVETVCDSCCNNCAAGGPSTDPTVGGAPIAEVRTRSRAPEGSLPTPALRSEPTASMGRFLGLSAFRLPGAN